MPTREPSRRDFIQSAGSVAGGAWLAMHLPSIQSAALFAKEAVRSGQSFETLTAVEAEALQAIASRFYPTDDTPGATEAGVVYFMDRSLGSFFSWMLEPLRDGLVLIEGQLRVRHPGTDGFASLTTDQQDALIRWLEDQDPNPMSASNPFFLLQVLCSCGMFGSPDLGGNRNGVGWTLVGFEPPRAWEPPFGYYDEQVMRSGGEE